jgi:uncharacterized membrane protein YbhN (UPF0104 family)
MTGPRRQLGVRRVLAWVLALAALGFVVHAVPVRDRCDDPAVAVDVGARAPGPRVAVSRNDRGCVLHRAAGDESLTAQECARLRCEPGLASTLAAARLGPLAALLALYFGSTFVWATRYRTLLSLARVHVGSLEAWRITLESQAGGVLLPGGIGGDALRVAFVVGKGASVTTVIAAVLLDRAIGLSTVAGLAAALAVMVGGGDLGAMTLALGAVPVALMAGLALARRGPVARALEHAPGPIARVARPVLGYLGDPAAPRAIARAIGFSLIVSAVQLTVIRGIVYALGGEPLLERWVYLGTTMAFIVGVLPALPGGWGTSDAAFVFFLGKAGLAAPLALGVSLMFRLFWYASAAVGATLYLLRPHANAPPAPVAPSTTAEPGVGGKDGPTPRTP